MVGFEMVSSAMNLPRLSFLHFPYGAGSSSAVQESCCMFPHSMSPQSCLDTPAQDAKQSSFPERSLCILSMDSPL